MVTAPSLIAIESFASMASAMLVIFMVPPVILMSSLPLMPLSVELISSVPRPLNTRSSLEKITASVLVVPSAVKVPITDRLLTEPSAVVTNTLSAFLT